MSALYEGLATLLGRARATPLDFPNRLTRGLQRQPRRCPGVASTGTTAPRRSRNALSRLLSSQRQPATAAASAARPSTGEHAALDGRRPMAGKALSYHPFGSGMAAVAELILDYLA
jgi:hypothetical protein